MPIYLLPLAVSNVPGLSAAQLSSALRIIVANEGALIPFDQVPWSLRSLGRVAYLIMVNVRCGT